MPKKKVRVVKAKKKIKDKPEEFQTLIFDRDIWSLQDSVGLFPGATPIKILITKKTFTLILQDPKKFKKLKLEPDPEGGVSVILGTPK